MSLLQDLIAAEVTALPHVDQSQRFRLVPTQGRSRSRFVFGAEVARQEAERSFAETGIPVLVCFAPPDDIVKQQYIVGKVADKKQRRS